MVGVVFKEYPKCPKCNGQMVPLSSTETHVETYGSDFKKAISSAPVVFACWKCINCGFLVDKWTPKYNP